VAAESSRHEEHASEGAPADDDTGWQFPTLLPGTELLGEYQGSGLTQRRFLLRRPDGQVLSLSQLLYLLAGELAEPRSVDQVAERLSSCYGRTVSAANSYLIEQKLAPLGVLDQAVREEAPPRTATGILSLRYRKAVIPARAHRRASLGLTGLFRPPVVVVALPALAGDPVGYRQGNGRLSHPLVRQICHRGRGCRQGAALWCLRFRSSGWPRLDRRPVPIPRRADVRRGRRGSHPESRP
jgi:hypothetical protein